ncbi:MAG: hypothetical protein B6I19_08930 [Bacteroidetes bacterium 4572_114]|nr:MAG: hypothetical protein B6I19_08930 [Bacteroidetes bacterium 4572_114]
MAGPLKKMIIEAHRQADYSDSAVETFTVMFNPTSYTQKYELEYQDEQGAGTTGSPQVFGKIKPQDYTFELVFDGTGAVVKETDVHKEVEHFLKVTGKHDGEIHRPFYLLLSWGKLSVKCVLKSAEITYNLFKSNGDPLRAKVKAVFSENIEETLRVAKERKSSPDLTHVRMVKDKTTLPSMAFQIYGDPSYYFQMAGANKLKHFRSLATGTELSFPPVKNIEK